MNFALVGNDPKALDLVRAIALARDDRLTKAHLTGSLQAEVARWAPAAHFSQRWDELLTDSSVDAVIVAGHEAETLEAARQLAAAGKPLLLVPHVAQSSAFLYELSLVHDDTGVLLFPVLPHREDAAVRQLRELLASGSLGTLLYFELTRERHAAARPGTAPLLSTGEIDETLLGDVDLLRHLGGDYNQVTALHSGSSADRIATATVTLGGAPLPESTWTMKGTPAASNWRLTAAGDKGTATVAGEDHQPSTLRVESSAAGASPAAEAAPAGGLPVASESAPEQAAAVLARFRAARDGAGSSREWTDLVRAFELVEASHRSIRRRRTIDLHFESTSERSQFKTQMTAIGCGVLSLTLAAVVFLLVATAVFDVRDVRQLDAERAGAVFSAAEFLPDSPELSDAGQTRVEKLAPRMATDRFDVLIEQTEEGDPLAERRRNSVVEALRASGVEDADGRTATAEIKGRWLAKILRVARIAVFVPLLLFLLLQLLLFLTRPAAGETN